MSIVTTLATRITVRRATGLPPKELRPGTWSPGSRAEVRVAVTTSALHHATLAYFLEPTVTTWEMLMAAQYTADAARA